MTEKRRSNHEKMAADGVYPGLLRCGKVPKVPGISVESGSHTCRPGNKAADGEHAKAGDNRNPGICVSCDSVFLSAL
jgi:hypothetical protein